MKLLLTILITAITLNCTAQSKPSLNKSSKKFNGLYIFNDQLSEIFPVANVEYNNSRIATTVDQPYLYNSACIVIVNNFYPNSKDITSLKSFVQDGNYAFIFASDFNDTFQLAFHLTTSSTTAMQNELLIKEIPNNEIKRYKFKPLSDFNNKFELESKALITVLGYNSDGTPNFIKYSYGKGAVFIHLYPTVLLNYFLVNQSNYAYTETLLSYLPRNLNKIFITTAKNKSNNYDSSSGEDNSDILDFIKNNPNLWAALLLLLLLLGLLILFGLKRRQRIIPIKQPVTNTTMEFAQTIGDLYFNQKDNNDIALKKVKYWQELIRTKYQIPTTTMNLEFWERVQKKSGASETSITNIKQSITALYNGQQFSDRHLVEFTNNIDNFNKK